MAKTIQDEIDRLKVSKIVLNNQLDDCIKALEKLKTIEYKKEA